MNKQNLPFKSFIFFLLIAGSQGIFAQTGTQVPSDQAYASPTFMVNDTLRRWSIGVNLYPAITEKELFEYSLRQPRQVKFPLEVLVRKQYQLNKAWRFRAMGIMEKFAAKDFKPNDENTTNYSIDLALGHEWQEVISRRWKLYYGAELQARHTKWRTVDVYEQYYYSLLDEFIWYKRDFSTNRERLSVLPFLGSRYQITPRLFVSAEISLEFFTERHSFYQYSEGRELENMTIIVPRGGGMHFQFNSNGLHLVPYTGVYLNMKL